MKNAVLIFAIAILGSNIMAQETNFVVDTEKSEIIWHSEKVTGSEDGTIKIKDSPEKIDIHFQRFFLFNS